MRCLLGPVTRPLGLTSTAGMEQAGPLDALGRRRRVYRRRVQPLREFSEGKFQARYRLSKAAVRQLIRLYGDYVARRGLPQAGGLSLADRVSNFMRNLPVHYIYKNLLLVIIFV